MKDPREIAHAAGVGYSIICATCVHLKHRPERHRDMFACDQGDCGGPLSGGDFARYQGPITDFSRWCFVCGEPSEYAAVAPDTVRRFGLCKEHVSMMDRVRPVGGTRGPVVSKVIDPKRGLVSIEQLLGRPQKTLGQAIAEAEAHFAEKDGKA